MTLERLSQLMLPAIEASLRQALAPLRLPLSSALHQTLTYHMGWSGEGAGPQARGKRIRPLLVTLTTAAASGAWQNALPAAAAVELLHNFSLIHDDIEDNSPLRRGRPTVWAKWGIPQAVNAGDALLTLAHLTIFDLQESQTPETVIQAARLLQETCLHLTEGQHLDLAYEGRQDLTLDDYWPMVAGKTAALLAACTELGALVAGAEQAQRQAYRQFGHDLGLAFQVQDDLLGIWGDALLTGKSNQSDLVEGKKSLPVLYGLTQQGAFAEAWRRGRPRPEAVPALAAQLRAEGAYDYAKNTADELTARALQALTQANPQGEGGAALTTLAQQLLTRQV